MPIQILFSLVIVLQHCSVHYVQRLISFCTPLLVSMSRSTSKVRAEKSRAASVLPPPPSPAHHVDSTSTVPGRLSKSEWMDMVAQEEGEEVVAEVLDELMCSVMKRCYQVYLQSQVRTLQ